MIYDGWHYAGALLRLSHIDLVKLCKSVNVYNDLPKICKYNMPVVLMLSHKRWVNPLILNRYISLRKLTRESFAEYAKYFLNSILHTSIVCLNEQVVANGTCLNKYVDNLSNSIGYAIYEDCKRLNDFGLTSSFFLPTIRSIRAAKNRTKPIIDNIILLLKYTDRMCWFEKEAERYYKYATPYISLKPGVTLVDNRNGREILKNDHIYEPHPDIVRELQIIAEREQVDPREVFLTRNFWLEMPYDTISHMFMRTSTKLFMYFIEVFDNEFSKNLLNTAITKEFFPKFGTSS